MYAAKYQFLLALKLRPADRKTKLVYQINTCGACMKICNSIRREKFMRKFMYSKQNVHENGRGGTGNIEASVFWREMGLSPIFCMTLDTIWRKTNVVKAIVFTLVMMIRM